MLTVEEYWEQHIASIGASVGVYPQPGSEAMVKTVDGLPSHGFIQARIWFNSEDFLDVYEYVEIDANSQPHRVVYSYHLRVEDQDVRRWDREPGAIHELYHHINRTTSDGDNLHIAAERVTLKKVVEECWGIIDQTREGDWPT